MRTPRTVRALGWLLLACGVFLAGLMSYLWIVLGPAMAHPGDLTGGTTFTVRIPREPPPPKAKA